jgi:hypothetical protein
MSSEVLQASKELNQINPHHETPSQVLGMGVSHNQVDTRASQSTMRFLEKRHLTECKDGSHLFLLDHAVYAVLREQLPAGSILETGVISATSNLKEYESVFETFSTVAIILGHKTQETHLLGLVRKPRHEEKERGMKQGVWGSYTVQNEYYYEKKDAYMALQRFFSLQDGVEGSQILSSVFNTKNFQMKGTEDPLTEAGCYSHDKPLQAIPENLLIGSTQSFPITIHGETKNRVVRVRLSKDSTRIEPMAKFTDASDENHLMRIGLITKSRDISNSNPQGFGRGTSEESVLTAMMKTAVELPEIAGNNGTNRDAARLFRKNMGLT